VAAKGAGKRFQLKLVAPESVKWAIIGVSSASYGLGDAYRIVPVSPCILIVDELSRLRSLTGPNRKPTPHRGPNPSIPILERPSHLFSLFP
jgi:hypothetical protein